MTPPVATQSVMSRSAKRAFSLIELLVVITIIAVVIAITVPALSGARDLARKAATEATVNSLVQAISGFQADNQRAPGYFSAEEMGNGGNIDRGFSQMQNIMLDLVGGPIESGASNPNALKVGPTRALEIDVDPSLINIGSNSKGYYTPDASDYKPVEGIEAIPDHMKLPDVIDAWGMPILAWAESDTGSIMNDQSDINSFAQISALQTSSLPPARFYWAQNSGALSATVLGKRQVDQATDSLLGLNVPDTERVEHMTALLGSPNSSVKSDANYRSILPRVGRGEVVFQSAGSDRVFLAKKDSGYGRLAGQFVFGRNLTPNANINAGQYDRKDGTKGSIDIVEGFDDIVTSAGN